MTHLLANMILALILECCYCAPSEMSSKYNKIEPSPKHDANKDRVNPGDGAHIVEGYYYYSPGWSQETISGHNSVNLYNHRDPAIQNAAPGLDGRKNWARNGDPFLMYHNNYHEYVRNDVGIPVQKSFYF